MNAVASKTDFKKIQAPLPAPIKLEATKVNKENPSIYPSRISTDFLAKANPISKINSNKTTVNQFPESKPEKSKSLPYSFEISEDARYG